MKMCLLCISKGYGESFNCIPGKLYLDYELDKDEFEDKLYIITIGGQKDIFYKRRFIEVPYSRYIKLLYDNS